MTGEIEQSEGAAREGGSAAVGDCYVVAAQLVAFGDPRFDGARLVHASVLGQGPIEGVRHGHAWVEVRAVVPNAGGFRTTTWVAVDWSNGKQIEMKASEYRRLGQAENVRTYTAAQASALMLDSGTFGPWHNDGSGQ